MLRTTVVNRDACYIFSISIRLSEKSVDPILTRMKIHLPSIVLAACLALHTADTFAETVAPVRNNPGKKNETVQVGDLNRSFIVYVGASVGATTAASVVFMLHGTSGDGERFYQISRWQEKADEVGLIAVFPDALTHCFHEDENRDGDFVDNDELKVTTKWTHGELGDPAHMPLCSAQELANLPPQLRNLSSHPFQDDVLFFDAMVSFLRGRYVVDERRIYVSGFSNGAQMASRLAIERSHVFAAAAAHAGFVSVLPSGGRPMSFIFSVGSRDDRYTVPSGISELPMNESVATNSYFRSNAITPMLQQLQLEDSYTYDEPVINGATVARFTYGTSTSGESNVFYFAVVDENLHEFPNGTNHPLVMANVHWTLFATQQLPGNEIPFTITDRASLTRTTSGSGAAITTGYGTIKTDLGSTTPAGLGIFGFSQNGVLVSEAAVPASPVVQSGRIYAEISGNVNTGVAFANPNSQPATIDFYFSDSAGVNFNSGRTTLAANGQMAAFLNQPPFTSGVQGNLANARTFTFSSTLPVSLIALRGLTNERGEFLITTLPVTASGTTGQEPLILPHFADGGGWTTRILLVNPTDNVISGNAQFWSAGTPGLPGVPIQMTANGTTTSSFLYSIPPRSSYSLSTSGADANIRVGSVRVVPSAGSLSPTGVAVFGFRNGAGIVVTEAGVNALPAASAYRLYVEASGNFSVGELGSIQSGFAIANSLAADSTVTFQLSNLDGSPTGFTGTATVPANGQVSLFLNQIAGLQSLPSSFRGVLRVSGTGITVTGLRGRYNQRGDFLITSTSPFDESLPATFAVQMFPHVVNGGGYTTQFILFSGSAGQTAAGGVLFHNQTGQPLNIY
jgi:polyhydroxybutyrate depolymerase